MSGAIFSLFAIGLVVLYSVSGVFNFAHGAIAFLAGLLFYQVVLGLGLPKPVAFVIVMFVFAPLLGMLLEKAVFRDLAKAPEAQRIVGSVGLALALPAIGFFLVELCINTFGWDLASMEVVQSVPGLGPDVPVFFDVGPVRVSSNQLIVLGVTALCGIIVAVIMARTRFGLETHAVVDRRSLATMRGINAARLSRLGWILGTMLGAIAGIVSGPMFGLNQSLGLHFVIASSAVVVIAKFRSLKVAMFGGLLLGAASNLFIGYIDEVPGIGATIADLPGLSVSTVYIILFAALAWRGRTNVRIGSTIPDPVPVDHLEGLSRFRRWWPWVVFGAVLASWQLGIIPIGALQAGGIERALMVTGLAYGIVYLSFTVVLGMAGRVSMAQAALVTAAQLSAGFVVGHRILGGGFLISLIVGVTVAALLGAVVALPALRLGGTALAMATLALALIGDQMLFRIDSLRNSTRGWTLSRPALGPLNLDEDHHYAILVALFLLGAIWVVTNLRESATGRSLLATRTSPEAAASVGISSRRATLTAFAISGALAGLGGVLLGFGSKIVNESTYPAMTGLLWLAVAVSWGVRRPASAVLAGMLGAFFPRMLSTGFLFIPETDSAQIPMILFGLGAVGLAKDPDGVVSTVSGALARRRRRRAGATEEATTPPANGVQAASGTPTSVGATAPPSSPVRASDAALVVQGLRAGYAGVEVLHGVDLVVPRGEIVGLIGPNGAGKSTLAAALAGVVETTHGDLRLEGVDIFPLSSYERARAGLAVVPESRGIFPKLTVEENLLVTLADRADHDAVYQRFPILGERRQQPAGNLSGGEQQMLTLAPFLARPPRVLVVDEPTLGLAPRIVGEVLEVLSQLRDEGSSILIIEEQARHILRLADRLTLVSLGTTTWTGAVAEFDADLMADAYLGVTRDERGRSGGREDAGPPRMSIDDHMTTDEGRT